MESRESKSDVRKHNLDWDCSGSKRPFSDLHSNARTRHHQIRPFVISKACSLSDKRQRIQDCACLSDGQEFDSCSNACESQECFVPACRSELNIRDKTSTVQQPLSEFFKRKDIPSDDSNASVLQRTSSSMSSTKTECSLSSEQDANAQFSSSIISSWLKDPVTDITRDHIVEGLANRMETWSLTELKRFRRTNAHGLMAVKQAKKTVMRTLRKQGSSMSTCSSKIG